MSAANRDLDWRWFRGRDVQGSLLQSLCLFRSQVLYDRGLRESFGQFGATFGDIQYADFDSYHIVATRGPLILGAVRITPPQAQTITLSILGPEKYADLIRKVNATPESVVEINRLVVDRSSRDLVLGKTLMCAAVALTEMVWHGGMTIIGTSGNNAKQINLFLRHLDCERIQGVDDVFCEKYNDTVSFVRYKEPPYVKGAQAIDYFKQRLQYNSPPDFEAFQSNYHQTTIPTLLRDLEASQF